MILASFPDVTPLLKWLEASSLAANIRSSLFLFPLLESAHVFGLALVFGTIAVIDLRLLGVASTGRPFKLMATDILKWTWLAFALTGITGALMFTTNAQVYYHNSFFRAKMLLLVLAGINMLVFELTDGRKVQHWDNGGNIAGTTPRGARAAAVLSIVIWVAVIFMGRIVGFTTTRAAVAAPPPAGVDFDNFLTPGK